VASSPGRFALPGIVTAVGCGAALLVISAGVCEPRRSNYAAVASRFDGECRRVCPAARGQRLKLLKEGIRRPAFVAGDYRRLTVVHCPLQLNIYASIAP
jgi:hypothetical protein